MKSLAALSMLILVGLTLVFGSPLSVQASDPSDGAAAYQTYTEDAPNVFGSLSSASATDQLDGGAASVQASDPLDGEAACQQCKEDARNRRIQCEAAWEDYPEGDAECWDKYTAELLICETTLCIY